MIGMHIELSFYLFRFMCESHIFSMNELNKNYVIVSIEFLVHVCLCFIFMKRRQMYELSRIFKLCSRKFTESYE